MRTASFIIALSLLLLSPAATSATSWDRLTVTYGVFPGDGFFELPRRWYELIWRDWVRISGCCDANLHFPGDRYVRNKDEFDVVLIFDGNGFIAGIQSVVPLDKTLDDRFYNFKDNPFYQRGTLFNKEVYFVTVYFVDPTVICNGGRNYLQFLDQGTGNSIYLQSGPTPDNRRAIPVTEAAMNFDPDFIEQRCWPLMGTHYYPVPQRVNDPNYPACRDMWPIQAMYNDGRLNGIVFLHYTELDGSRWETLNELAAATGLIETPQCMKQLLANPGMRSMHVFLRDNVANCTGKHVAPFQPSP